MINNALPAEDYVLFADKSKQVRALTKNMLFMLPFLLPYCALCYSLIHGLKIPIHLTTPPYSVRYVPVRFPPALSALLTWIPCFLLAEIVFVYLIAARSIKKQTKPILVLSSDGICVRALSMELIRWDEIEEIRTYKFIHRFVGIVPKSTRDLCRRMKGSSAWLLRLTAACVPLYNLFGIFVAPIGFAEIYLPITADELLARITTYQTAYRQQSNGFHPGIGLPIAEGVWPPAPRNQQEHV